MKILDPEQLSGMKAVDLKSLAEQVAEDTSASYDAKSAALTAIGSALATRQQAIAGAKAWSMAGAPEDGRPPAGVGGPLAAPIPAVQQIAPPLVPGVRGKAPALAISDAAMRALFDAGQHRTSYATKAYDTDVQAKAYTTVVPNLPPQLATEVLGPQHEGRLLDRLPVMTIQTPSIEFLQHSSTTGAPAITAEGAAKPELVFNVTTLSCTPAKIAAHVGISWESYTDYPGWTGYVTGELFRQIISVENQLLLSGSSGIVGLTQVSGVLTHNASSEQPLDSIEFAIAQLRTGAALATCDLIVLNPSTFSAIRRTKDSYGRYLAVPNPAQTAASTLWGVDVLLTTQLAAGTGILLDTAKFGFAAVREGLNLRTGSDGNDFTHNIQRLVAEERVGLAVERPSAVLVMSNLPTGVTMGS